MERDWKAYVTYCGPDQMKEYNLKNTDHIKLINIYEDMDLPNINHLNHHYSQIISMYYVWKNQLASDYVCIWDHRRYFTPIDFDKLDENYIQVYFYMHTDMTPYEYMLHEGINEYIIYSFIKYMIEKYNINHDKIIDLVYNKSWEDRLWLITGFNCNWKVFNDICDFTFGFINYLIPNGDYNSNDSIETFLKDMHQSMRILRHKCKDEEIIDYGRIESEDRYIGNITECLYPLFCELMGYKSLFCFDPKCVIINCKEFDHDKIYGQLCKCVHKSIFSGSRNFIAITTPERKQELIDIIKPYWYKLYHGNVSVYSTEDKLPYDLNEINHVNIDIDEYIDSDSPTDLMYQENVKKLEAD